MIKSKLMRKMISAVLCTVMAATLMTGCLSGQPVNTSATPAETTAASDAASGETEANANAVTPAADAITLKMAEVNPLDGTVCGAMDLKFKEKVEELSNGSIIIDLQGGGVLGVEADILDGMLGGTGTVDICRISAFALTSYGTKKSVLLSLPYTFNDRDHFWNFANSELGQEFLDESEELGLGVKGLYFGEEGFRHFFTVASKPIASPADMKNMKIRVSNDPIMTSMVQNLGATPSPVSMSEIYSSMQNGTIDGAEQPTVNYAGNSFQEVGPNLTMDGHTLGAMMTIISDAAWNKLTEEQQAIIIEAGKEASAYCREVSEERENEVLEELKGQGVNIIDITDKTEWQAACKPIADQYAVGDLADVYQQILGLAG
jgi:tripartite ATP-independent transporter DctP family solute receptor